MPGTQLQGIAGMQIFWLPLGEGETAQRELSPCEGDGQNLKQPQMRNVYWSRPAAQCQPQS